MVEKFDPELKHVVSAKLSLTDGPIISAEPITYEIAEQLINADTERKVSKLFSGVSPLFSNDPVSEETIQDVEAARHVLIEALEARYYIGTKFVSESLLCSLGVSVMNLDGEKSKWFHKTQKEIASRFDGRDRRLFEVFSGDTTKRIMNIAGDAFGASFSLYVESKPYGSYLKQACERVPNWSAFNVEDVLIVELHMGFYEYSESGFSECLRDLVDGLFSLHLHDLRTVSANGGEEKRVADTALTSIWWATLDKLRDGRLGKCKACGKPFIAKRERGSKRMYCCDACRQRKAPLKSKDQSTETALRTGVLE